MREAILIGLLVWNVLVFAYYGFDKRQALHQKWRVSEKTLLLLTICFGGLGAFVAGRFFRHKTRKWYFVLFWYLGLGLVGIVLYLVWQLNR